MMSVDEFVKLILAVSGSIAIVGISVQIMRLLGTLNSTMQDFRYITHQVADIIDKVRVDYEKLRNNLKEMTSPITSINENVVAPIVELSTMLGAGIKTVKKYIKS